MQSLGLRLSAVNPDAQSYSPTTTTSKRRTTSPHPIQPSGCQTLRVGPSFPARLKGAANLMFRSVLSTPNRSVHCPRPSKYVLTFISRAPPVKHGFLSPLCHPSRPRVHTWSQARSLSFLVGLRLPTLAPSSFIRHYWADTICGNDFR